MKEGCALKPLCCILPIPSIVVYTRTRRHMRISCAHRFRAERMPPSLCASSALSFPISRSPGRGARKAAQPRMYSAASRRLDSDEARPAWLVAGQRRGRSSGPVPVREVACSAAERRKASGLLGRVKFSLDVQIGASGLLGEFVVSLSPRSTRREWGPGWRRRCSESHSRGCPRGARPLLFIRKIKCFELRTHGQVARGAPGAELVSTPL